MTLTINPILDTDSYKASHFLQYPPETTGMYSYLESRGGRYDETLFFGLQYFLEEYVQRPIRRAVVEEAARFFELHGEPFNLAGWNHVVEAHGGVLPVRIRAVAEGTVVPTHNALVTVVSTDPRAFWVVSWLETQLVRMWYPITVATQSFKIRAAILDALERSADDPLAEIGFKLHDFGARGVSSRESAGIGGMAHLVSFLGSDTVEGVRFANHYYGSEMAGFSIPAAEHSTMTMWGRDREVDAFRNMLTQYGGPGKAVACVSDSYDYFHALEHLWAGELAAEVEATGGTLVIRPDSGDPEDVVLRTLQVLERAVGMATNAKGFKVLPAHFRVIQGDGVCEGAIRAILATVLAHGYSASNLAFGMGGALLQRVDRDTQKFAFKCSSATIGGREIDVFKDPVTDPGKTSKKGRLALVRRDGRLSTVRGTDVPGDLLETVFEDGRIVRRHTLDEIRGRALR